MEHNKKEERKQKKNCININFVSSSFNFPPHTQNRTDEQTPAQIIKICQKKGRITKKYLNLYKY